MQQRTKMSPSTETSVHSSNVVASRGDGVSRATGNFRGEEKEVSRGELHCEIQAFLDAPFHWHSEIRSFWTIVMFVTTLPVPSWVDLHPGFLMNGMCYFPVIGCLLGACLALSFDSAAVIFHLPVRIASAFSTAAGFYLTGCLHEDGLADSADGELQAKIICQASTVVSYICGDSLGQLATSHRHWRRLVPQSDSQNNGRFSNWNLWMCHANPSYHHEG